MTEAQQNKDIIMETMKVCQEPRINTLVITAGNAAGVFALNLLKPLLLKFYILWKWEENIDNICNLQEVSPHLSLMTGPSFKCRPPSFHLLLHWFYPFSEM